MPIREFRDRSDGIPESGREDSIFRGAGAFVFRAHKMPFLYAVSALGIAFTGPGAISLDALLGLHFLADPYLVSALTVLAIVGAAVTLTARRAAASVPSSH